MGVLRDSDTSHLRVPHWPVLLDESLALMRSGNQPILRILDCTFGRGGHSRAFLNDVEGCSLLALDRDLEAIAYGRVSFLSEVEGGRIRFHHQSFLDFAMEQERSETPEKFDRIFLDLGVSSPQLDEAHRGFSFREDGPLDMRMDSTRTLTASTIINEWNEEDLIELFMSLGEIRRPQRVVRAILKDRADCQFQSTRELASLIERVDGWKRRNFNPATPYFLALRLRVNEELDQVRDGLPLLLDLLKPGGRIGVITFHSLEDRIVKQIFKSKLEMGRLTHKKVIVPSRDEELRNPRSRSAKLRGFERNF